MRLRVKVHLNKDLCNMCKLCIDYCPTNVFVLVGSEIKVYEERCIYCKSCEVLCPTKAIRTVLLDDDLTIEVHRVL
ncbi:MAG: 4Fe-4S binding protein [Desulfurococcales archaeon]|nr:4Fe-4S binding protein [Desulfurococcales archaeon]